MKKDLFASDIQKGGYRMAVFKKPRPA